MTSVVITGMGAVSSVGLDAATTCASIRAGLSRPETLVELEVLDREEQAPVGVTGHPASAVTFGFGGVGRWLQLATLALEDLCRSAGLPGGTDTRFWSSTLCYVVVPVLDVARFIMEPSCGSDAAVEGAFVRPLLARVKRALVPGRTNLLGRGRTGVLEALRLADEHFRRVHCERVLVLAVDSLTDASTLSWLAEHGRLKHDENPIGLIPGEGAVALLLEAPRVAVSRGATVVGRVGAVAIEREPNARFIGERSQGEALARAVTSVLSSDGGALPYRAPTLTDLNGEEWRAREYGHARVRVSRQLWDGDGADLPATSVGDLGAAMTALEVLIACRSLQRGYAVGDRVLFTSSDEYGNVGASTIWKGA
ncbi:hypothetical protein [Paraliomyxa miuraensis]|uniref:hypothetical protein n=1 Tax=Paraliomyxa miuraensis TaxID=376150 RepID=UPI00224C9C88|nr:hypothetical protein [Paraliomyxa miuraensis]MCX4242250.1 hypothetical protein [Paraliomyxa miuraensis]